MGSLFSYFLSYKEFRIMILGLSNTGKTTVLYQFAMDQLIFTLPTNGFNEESFKYKNKYYSVFDFEYSEDLLSDTYNDLLKSISYIIYVVDSSNVNSLNDSRKFLNLILSKNELKGKPLLVLANKQDLKGALKGDDIAEKLKLYEIRNRSWFIRETDALTGQGLKESLDWLSKFDN